jgi:3'(2'), 5'-bisphosphate nucleotidase
LTTADDHVLARDLAVAAGQLLLDLRGRGGDRDALRKSGDRLSHEFLAAELAARRPGDAVLSEEGIDDKARLAAQRVWIVDPLDGTREFGEDGRTDWAVHVALWERGADGAGTLTAGAVALPAQGRVLSTLVTPGRTTPLDPSAQGGLPAPHTPRLPAGGTPAPQPPREPLRLVVSRSRAPQLVRNVAAKLNAELVPCGSAGAKVATVITGETDAYLHAGGFYEWDTAAPVAVARSAGYHASRIDGTELTYNRENPLLPDILVCRPAIAGLLLATIQEATHAI